MCHYVDDILLPELFREDLNIDVARESTLKQTMNRFLDRQNAASRHTLSVLCPTYFHCISELQYKDLLCALLSKPQCLSIFGEVEIVIDNSDIFSTGRVTKCDRIRKIV